MKGQWPRLWMMLGRDLLIVAAVLAFWALLMAQTGSGMGVTVLQIVTGLVTMVAAYLLHEWGHLLGAWLGKGFFVLPSRPFESPFLFRFDNVRNSREQFLFMSGGGFVSSALAVALLVVALPSGMLASYIALGLTAIGVIATFAIELPEFLGVYRGARLPTGKAFVSPQELQMQLERGAGNRG